MMKHGMIKKMEKRKTERGFGIYEFKDEYNAKCSLQKSSSAMVNRIWLGVDDAEPKIMASQAAEHGIITNETNGWVEYPIPKEVLLNTRMHLNQKQAKKLVKILKKFIKTGEI